MAPLSVRVKAPIIRLSLTDISGKIRRPSGTMAMAMRTMSAGFLPPMRSSAPHIEASLDLRQGRAEEISLAALSGQPAKSPA